MTDIYNQNQITDDIFNPDVGNVPCNNLNMIQSDKVVLPLLGAISTICYFYLFWMYFVKKSPILLRHPTCKYYIQ